MAFKHSVRGEGFAKREYFEVCEPLTKADWKEIRKQEQGSEFRPPYFARLEAKARVTLEAAGYRIFDFHDRKAVGGLIRSRTRMMRIGPLWFALPSGPESPDSAFALKVLTLIFYLRRCIEKTGVTGASSDVIQVLGGAFQLGGLYEQAFLRRQWEKLALHGEKFEKGRKLRRLDALGKVLLKLLPASNDEVLNKLARLECGDVIEKVDMNDGKVYWKRSPNGEAAGTSFKAIENRLTSLRKKKTPA